MRLFRRAGMAVEIPVRCRLRESLKIVPFCFQGPARLIREATRFFRALRRPLRSRFWDSTRPLRGIVTAVLFSLARVLERFFTPVTAIETLTAPAFRGLKPALPPRLRFRENAKRFCHALEMLGRQRNTVKIGILAVFGPKPWTRPTAKHCKNRHFGRFWPEALDPPTPGRKRATGVIERPRLGRTAGIRFSGVSASLHDNHGRTYVRACPPLLTL